MTDNIFRFSAKLNDWTSKDAAQSKKVLGGKGAGLVMMTQAGLNVPPGFTITTAVCNAYRALAPNLKALMVKELMTEVLGADQWLEAVFGYIPLVSVRSGAPVSMPGMMDTILNVGLTTYNVDEWGKRLGERAAFDSYRRLIQMLGHTAYGVPMEVFDKELEAIKKEDKAGKDSDLSVAALKTLCFMYSQKFKAVTQQEFPNTREDQLRAAIKAVFDSWMNPRAIEYRKLNKIDEAMGTAVTVQSMVFGNMGEDSGTGVLFTRDPSTGDLGMFGEFLTNAQGEDVVAGIRTPVNVSKMPALGSAWHDTFMGLQLLCEKLEKTYKDMVDIEFTVQQGTLYVLQSRSGKRSARAAFKIAVDQVNEGLIDKKIAIGRLTPDQFKVVRRPAIDPQFKVAPTYTGLPACPGVVSGKPVFSSEAAIQSTEPCILVTHETTPDDIAGMAKAIGILTRTGGATSHAAVVARAMDKTCITGCTAMDTWVMESAKKVTIDGSTGHVWVDIDVPVIDSSDAPEIKTVMGWCMGVLGACEVAPVDIGMDHPHCVMAAFWWGNEEVMEAVLDGLAISPAASMSALTYVPRPIGATWKTPLSPTASAWWQATRLSARSSATSC